MLRAQLKRVSLSATATALRSRLTGAGPSKRRFGSFIPGAEMPPVPILRPTIFVLVFSAGIYFACAAHDVHRDISNARKRRLLTEASTWTYDDLEEYKHRYGGFSVNDSWSRGEHTRNPITELLSGYSNPEKFTLGVLALNIGFYGAGSLAPGTFMQHFNHVAVWSPNYTLLTSAFLHTNIISASFNTFAMIQIAPDVAREAFDGNGNHFAAFFLSTAAITSLGEHIAPTLPTRSYKMNRFAPTHGTTGVFMAMLGAYAVLHSDLKMNVWLSSSEHKVKDVATAWAVFELVGLLIGIPWLGWGHGSRLTGLAVGSAYIFYDGQKHVWQPSRKIAFRGMKLLGMV
ncbi:uncharacterized protein F4822DRAFT_399455 [Hypoxylon trugodes]|uniref:uncharacterized protein n=1 Tax=Hypoxylon trugodes TaxID=326681 RepID=UPI0021995617|nr:uncharacterized protein F4822DRAFT_399455 [Hypoxylon trugodes]KAI1389720.1 hypothetical protein F4822DRAFT_399455 [Hypoxylon trugodes]